jgi:hypothetical protein
VGAHQFLVGAEQHPGATAAPSHGSVQVGEGRTGRNVGVAEAENLRGDVVADIHEVAAVRHRRRRRAREPAFRTAVREAAADAPDGHRQPTLLAELSPERFEDPVEQAGPTDHDRAVVMVNEFEVDGAPVDAPGVCRAPQQALDAQDRCEVADVRMPGIELKDRRAGGALLGKEA